MGEKRRWARAAEIDQGDNKGKILAEQIIMISIIKDKKKNNEQKDDKREKKLEKFGFKKKFQIFINLVIFPWYFQDTKVFSRCKSALQV